MNPKIRSRDPSILVPQLISMPLRPYPLRLCCSPKISPSEGARRRVQMDRRRLPTARAGLGTQSCTALEKHSQRPALSGMAAQVEFSRWTLTGSDQSDIRVLRVHNSEGEFDSTSFRERTGEKPWHARSVESH
jgi:hypothetical protein